MAKAKAATVAALVAEFNKDYTENTVLPGDEEINFERIPTGLFELDLATGGGFPRGRASVIYGPESSGKTNIALLAIANHQRLWPHLLCVFFDTENAYDPHWAKALGVDTSKLYVVRPDFAEQAVDMVEALIDADDTGLIVFDSIAAMVTTQELDSSAEKAVVGGASVAVGKMVRKSTLGFSRAAKENRHPTLLYINQTRFKIGVMFGNPETQPGGNAIKFQSSLTLRVHGKNLNDSAVHKQLPVKKEINFVVQKSKCKILSQYGKMEMVTYPHKGLRPGETDSFTTVETMLRDYGVWEQVKGGWKILDATYKTIKEFKARYYDDRPFAAEIRAALIERELEEGGITVPGLQGEDYDADGELVPQA